ncbi:hypothetical protein KSS87_021275 [Heliosperma pusillum]|nr:hypothetical protein KSS87_021275 [Heliosperma pusillum]
MNINNSNVLGYKTAYISDLYILGHALGQGRYGSTTCECTEIATGIKYACKSIPKAMLAYKEDAEDIRREIKIMHHLADIRNIVSIKGEYEDDLEVHIVMELCNGGELFYPSKRWNYSAKTVAELVRIIVRVVATCHSLGVMIRGLKLDDFLLVSKHDILSIKAVGFGSSIFFKPGEEFTEVVGSSYYIAPEVHFKQYGPEADIWSAGVILYILLSGVPPFWGETRKEVRTAVLKATRYTDFESDPWPLVSDSAMQLIKNMLCSQPLDRFTAAQVLRHPWIYQNGVAPDKPLPSSVLSRLTQFSEMVKLNRFTSWQVYNAIVEQSQNASDPGQDGYNSCTCAESQKAYCRHRDGNGSQGSISGESNQASDPGQDGYNSCACAESQRAYCRHRDGNGSQGSISGESNQATDPGQDGYDSCGLMADEPRPEYNPAKYEEFIEENHLDPESERKFFEGDDEEGYAQVQPINPLTYENKVLRAMNRSLTSENDSLRADITSVNSENDALRVVVQNLTSENDALKCLNKESRESTKEENTQTLFQRFRQSVGL